MLPSAVYGYERGPRYDAVVATALAKDPRQRFANAAEFRQALRIAAGQALAAQVSDETVIALPPRPAAPAGVSASEASAGSAAPAPMPVRWDDRLLAEVETTLARHVGPVAAVMVRRAARECEDLPSLLARLAEQVSHPGAKAAFLEQATQSPTLGSATRRTAVTAAPTAAAATTVAAPIDEAVLAQATRLLAQQVGPIAGVLVKRAAARAPDRAAFYGALADAVPDAAARERLRAALVQLG